MGTQCCDGSPNCSHKSVMFIQLPNKQLVPTEAESAKQFLNIMNLFQNEPQVKRLPALESKKMLEIVAVAHAMASAVVDEFDAACVKMDELNGIVGKIGEAHACPEPTPEKVDALIEAYKAAHTGFERPMEIIGNVNGFYVLMALFCSKSCRVVDADMLEIEEQDEEGDDMDEQQFVAGIDLLVRILPKTTLTQRKVRFYLDGKEYLLTEAVDTLHFVEKISGERVKEDMKDEAEAKALYKALLGQLVTAAASPSETVVWLYGLTKLIASQALEFDHNEVIEALSSVGFVSDELSTAEAYDRLKAMCAEQGVQSIFDIKDDAKRQEIYAEYDKLDHIQKGDPTLLRLSRWIAGQCMVSLKVKGTIAMSKFRTSLIRYGLLTAPDSEDRKILIDAGLVEVAKEEVTHQAPPSEAMLDGVEEKPAAAPATT